MARPQTFPEIYQKVTKKITSSADDWKSFLTFSGKVYKYSFPKKLMIYEQKSSIEYLADFRTWNRLGRLIKPDEVGIILYENERDRFSIQQLFDFPQTYGEDISFPDWEIPVEETRELISVFHEQVFSEPLQTDGEDVAFYDLIDFGIDYYARKDTAKFISQDQHKLFIAESVNYLIGQKISSFRTISDDFVLNQIRQYKPGFELNNIGVVVSEVSKKMLQHIHSIHLEIKKEEEKKHEQSIIADVQSGTVRSTVTGLRDASEGVSEGELPDPLHDAADGRHLDGVPAQSSRVVDQPRDEFGAADVEDKSLPTDGESTSNRSPFESDPIPSEGTSESDDSETNRQPIDEPEKEAEETLLPFFDPNEEGEASGNTDTEAEIISAVIPQSMVEELVSEKSPNEFEQSDELTETFDLFDFDFSGDDTAQDEVSSKKQSSKNFYLSTTEQYSNGKKAKFRDNLRAIRMLNQLESGEVSLNQESQEILAKYSGWGGLQEAFDNRIGSWQEEYNELKQLLPEKEYEKARSSVLTAFFTPSEIIHEMYSTLNQVGDFSQKKILDPGMGTGNFFMNLPEKLRATDQIGIEIDPLTSRIAKQLLPDATIHQSGYENVEISEKVDVVITNVPFNDIRVRDKKYDRYRFSIHDYFLAKSIDVLKENGILMVITSSASMDKKNDKAREYLAKRANLVGAIRLPKTAFRQSAGTEVISDILLFQKKSYAELTQAYEAPSWLDSIPHPDYPEIQMNRYFVENPDQILGEIAIKNFHGQTMDILPNIEISLSEQLKTAFSSFLEDREFLQTSRPNKNHSTSINRSVVTTQPKNIEIPADARRFTFLEIESSIVYHHSDGKYDLIPMSKRQQKIRTMLSVKAVLNDVIALQQDLYSKDQLDSHLEKLNTTYDRFTARYGFFNSKENIRDLRMDDQYPLLRSIEKEQNNTFVKQPIFYKATIQPRTFISEVDTATKALELSLAKTSRVDFSFIQSIYPNHSIEQIIGELGSQIFLNPKKVQSLGFENSWEYCDEYLTGNVKEKLAIATLSATRETDGKLKQYYEMNIPSLEAAQPPPLQAGDIDFKLGSPWIPLKYYNEFMYELLEVSEYRRGKGPGRVFIDFLDHNATWRVVGAYRNTGDVLSSKTFGTSRKNAYEIIEAALNLQQVKVNDKVLDEETNKYKYVLNPEQTMIAREKQAEIEDVFKQWLFSDSDRRIDLLEIYNEKFNNIVPRTYNGDSLVFDDMNIQMALRPHQKNVVARILYSGSALMAHEVGAGKTAAMLSAGMYLKKNNIITKPLYVVPNHLTEQWGKEILTFYPSANILITTKKDFEKENRNQFVSKIATGDYDAIIIGHSQFERIPLSQERQEEMIRNQIYEVTNIVEQLYENDGQRWSIKQMEKFKENLEDKLERLHNEAKKDNLLTFEQLGVDFLFVDEAHVYKNLFTYTKMQNVAGIGKSNSQRATDMLNKVRYIQEMHDGKNVVFATGTPISNSMSEMYVMQYFLQPQELSRRGLTSFDNWAATFGQVVSSLEITPEGNGYRMRDRFSKFHNLPELMNMFNMVADIQTSEMLDLPIPRLKGDKVQTLVTNKTAFQDQMMDDFVTRSEAIRNGMVNPRDDNMLKLTHEAKLMAIDSRLVDPDQPRETDSKLSVCCDIIYNIWKENADQRSTQIVFSDAGTPRSDQFNVYDEIKNQLTEKGIPAEEIAFIHDAKTDLQKDTLFEKMRSGNVRILLGSTQKVGTGTNVQNKLIAAHHIDCPWKPSDLVQREGRILRQGNENEEVAIYRYVTKGTFDSYLWQIQEQKLTYISQVMTGKSISRSCEDLDETVLSASEVKAIATENPLLAEKMSIDNDVTRLKLLRSQWENQRSRLDQDLRITYPNKLASSKDLLSKYELDLNTLEKNPIEDFEMMMHGKRYTKRQEAFDEMQNLYLLAPTDHNGNGQIEIGEFRGLSVLLERSVMQDNIVLKGEATYRANFTIDTGIGNITRLMHLPDRTKKNVQKMQEDLQDTLRQIGSAEKAIEKPFSRQEDFDEKMRQQRELTKEIEMTALKRERASQVLEESK